MISIIAVSFFSFLGGMTLMALLCMAREDDNDG